MLNNASGFRKVYIAAGYTDLRRGIDGLASIVKFNFQLDPYEKDWIYVNTLDKKSRKVILLFLMPHLLSAEESYNQ